MQGYVVWFHRGVQVGTTPVQSWLYRGKLGILGPLETFRDIGRGKQTQEELQKRNAFLESQIAQMGELRLENDRLRGLVGSPLPGTWFFTPEKVILVQTDSISITASSETKGKPVVVIDEKNQQGIFLGHIDRLVGKRADISLPTQANIKITAAVKDRDTGEKRASGVVEGKGGRAIIDQVLTGETLKEGDLIVTTGDAQTPPGLLIGYVGKILQVREGTFAQAEIEVPVVYSSLDSLFVITKF